MATNDLDLTVVGWVGSDPRLYPGADGQVPYTQFRVGSTARRWDREQGTYTDDTTDWFTVKVFREMARNVSDSVRRGDPVVVRGRLHLEEWTDQEQQTRTTAVLTANAVGHNLERGVSRFSRVLRESAGGRGDAPTDRSAGDEPRDQVPDEADGPPDGAVVGGLVQDGAAPGEVDSYGLTA